MARLSGCIAAALMSLSAPIALAQEAVTPEDSGGTDGDVAGVLDVRFVPTARAQLALWLERDDGQYVQTLRLTEAVSRRGIGNRPGASQMNSGFRWPYGRREGVLPVWARVRAAAPGARPWRRVIFQNRPSEGDASRTFNDQSPDDYYCLSFQEGRSSKDALDAVSCPTQFYSDKGRFITGEDVLAGYAEPYQDLTAPTGHMRPLTLTSLYPPRTDIGPCEGLACFDHPDAATFAAHAREIMPDIDAVTMATPVGGVQQQILFAMPSAWEPGDYRVCLEVNVEGDHNDTFSPESYPTPHEPAGSWDWYSERWGYPYRGQPSVVYCVEVELGRDDEARFATSEASGSSATWDIESDEYGELRGMEGMTDDPVAAPGSGADRLALFGEGDRLEVIVRPPLSCDDNMPPGAVTELALGRHDERLHAHEWAELSFRAAGDDHGIFRYDVRVSRDPIVDETSFMSAEPAKNATRDAAELQVPVYASEGEAVQIGLGGLIAQTHYFVGVRAIDACAMPGPLSVTEFTTPARKFATVSPCFVATAAWGTPLSAEIGSLRRLRDRFLVTTAPGRALVSLYYELGPHLAALIAPSEELRSIARSVLSPLVALADWLDS